MMITIKSNTELRSDNKNNYNINLQADNNRVR